MHHEYYYVNQEYILFYTTFYKHKIFTNLINYTEIKIIPFHLFFSDKMPKNLYIKKLIINITQILSNLMHFPYVFI